jgi:hypothetical protein
MKMCLKIVTASYFLGYKGGRWSVDKMPPSSPSKNLAKSHLFVFKFCHWGQLKIFNQHKILGYLFQSFSDISQKNVFFVSFSIFLALPEGGDLGVAATSSAI